MSARKSAKSAKGLVPKLKDFWLAIGERYQRILQVVDEALNSENLKERIWAAEFLLKRVPPPEKAGNPTGRPRKAGLTATEIKKMDNEALLAKIRESLGAFQEEPGLEEGEAGDVAD